MGCVEKNNGEQRDVIAVVIDECQIIVLLTGHAAARGAAASHQLVLQRAYFIRRNIACASMWELTPAFC
jgi:hypothetical protein